MPRLSRAVPKMRHDRPRNLARVRINGHGPVPRLTGARPSEVWLIHPCDIDRSQSAWIVESVPEAKRGPLMLQGDHGPVAYRNIGTELIQLD
jgi:hypothetical protein